MKKIIAFSLILVMIMFAFASCNNEGDAAEGDGTTYTVKVTIKDNKNNILYGPEEVTLSQEEMFPPFLMLFARFLISMKQSMRPEPLPETQLSNLSTESRKLPTSFGSFFSTARKSKHVTVHASLLIKAASISITV